MAGGFAVRPTAAQAPRNANPAAAAPLNNGNPAVNYYNFVRPNLPGPYRQGMAPAATIGWGPRMSYFPNLQSLDDEDIPGQQPLKKKDAERFR